MPQRDRMAPQRSPRGAWFMAKDSVECELNHNEFIPPVVGTPLSGDRKRHVPRENEMNILSAIFGSDPAAEICVGSLVFLVIYLVGFVLFQRWSRISRPTPVIHRHIISGLSAALAALGVGSWLHSANVTTASAEGQIRVPTSISPQELHQSIKMKSLPAQTFEDHTLVFPNHD